MTASEEFAAVLKRYVTRSAYTPGQLASLCGLPKSTIVNWLAGRVNRPREWQTLVQLLAVLPIQEENASSVLQAAGYPPLSELRRLATAEEQPLLVAWPGGKLRQGRAPFQAVADVPFFVGRQEIMNELAACLRRGQWCTVQGLPGVGKTALAVRLAYDLRPYFDDGVLWASVQQAEPMAILSTFARAYGADVSEYDDLDSRSRVVRDLLADKQALLVLDDAADSATVEAVLPPTGGPAVLITTRKQNLRVAQHGPRFTLLPFRPEGDASRALFVQFLGREKAEAQREALETLARLVGHLPLALVITAARLAYEPGWTAQRFLHQLQSESLQALRFEDQDVQAAFGISYEALGDKERAFFASLSAFAARDFSTEMAAAVAGCSSDAAWAALRSLHALSLVQAQGAERYRLHPLLAEFAATEAEDGTTGKRLLAHLTSLAEQYRHDDPRLEQELDHFLTVLDGEWSAASRPLLARLALALAPLLLSRGLYRRAEDYLIRVAEQGDDPLVRGRSLCYLARIARHRRQFEQAEQYLEQARQTPTVAPSLWAALRLEEGAIAACRNQYERASRELVGALPLARSNGDPDLLVPLLKEAGATAVALGRYQKARDYYAEAETLARRQSKRHLPQLLSCLGGIAIAYQRDYAAARPLYEEALFLVNQWGHAGRAAMLRNNLAATQWAAGQRAQAKAQLKEGLELARQARQQTAASMILANLGRLAVEEGAWSEAERYLAEAQQMAEGAAHQELIALAQESRARLAEVQSGRKGAAANGERLRIFFD